MDRNQPPPHNPALVNDGDGPQDPNAQDDPYAEYYARYQVPGQVDLSGYQLPLAAQYLGPGQPAGLPMIQQQMFAVPGMQLMTFQQIIQAGMMAQQQALAQEVMQVGNQQLLMIPNQAMAAAHVSTPHSGVGSQFQGGNTVVGSNPYDMGQYCGGRTRVEVMGRALQDIEPAWGVEYCDFTNVVTLKVFFADGGFAYWWRSNANL